MTLLCERCFGPIDPESERFYSLAHIAGADASGRVSWNHATVHTDACGPAAALTRRSEGRSEGRRAA